MFGSSFAGNGGGGINNNNAGNVPNFTFSDFEEADRYRLAGLNNRQLKELAMRKGIEIRGVTEKAEIINLLLLHRRQERRTSVSGGTQHE